MDRLKKILIFIILLMPVMVFADDGNVDVFIECSSQQIKVNETMTCTVSINATADIVDSDFFISLDEGLSFVQKNSKYFEGASALCSGVGSFVCDGLIANDGRLNVLLTTNPVAANTKTALGTFYVKPSNTAAVGSSYNIQISEDSFSTYSGVTVKENATASASLTVAAAETPTPVAKGLETLRVTSGGSVIPAFNKDSGKYTWQIQLDSATTTKFKILAEPANVTDVISAKVTGGATLDLNQEITFLPDDGESMSITLTVGSGDNQVSYVLIVTRPKEDKVGSPTLKSLTVGGTKVTLVSGQLDYIVTLDANAIKEYTIVAELSDSEHFKFKSTKVLSPNYLSGEQDIPISIVPKNESDSYGSEIYIITVKKAAGSTKTEEPEKPASGNPNTGPGPAIIMGLLLVSSFAASMYYYKKNISQYN